MERKKLIIVRNRQHRVSGLSWKVIATLSMNAAKRKTIAEVELKIIVSEFIPTTTVQETVEETIMSVPRKIIQGTSDHVTRNKNTFVVSTRTRTFQTLGSEKFTKLSRRSIDFFCFAKIHQLFFKFDIKHVSFELQRKPENINVYATKKTIAQGMLDVALLAANATQLKNLLVVSKPRCASFPALNASCLASQNIISRELSCFSSKNNENKTFPNSFHHNNEYEDFYRLVHFPFNPQIGEAYQFYIFALTLVCLSIALQVRYDVLFLFRWKINKPEEQLVFGNVHSTIGIHA